MSRSFGIIFMFFVFGFGPKSKVVEKNIFLCPVCHLRSHYERRQERSYFSLFFIPLIPLSKKISESVTCLQCGTKMPSTVLNHARPDLPPQSDLEA